jgi:hypothetical protein
MLLWTQLFGAIAVDRAAKLSVAAMKAAELRELLDLRGLGTGGKKAALAQRLLAAIRAEVVAVPAEEPGAEEEEEPAAAEAAAAQAAAAEASAAEAAVAETAASMEGPRPLTADEAWAAAAAEGLELVRSSKNQTGFRGVIEFRCKYRAQIRENGSKRYLRLCATPEEAALRYARHVGAERAAAEAAEARVAVAQPLAAQGTNPRPLY